MKLVTPLAALLLTLLPACGGYVGEVVWPTDVQPEASARSAAVPPVAEVVELDMRARVELARKLVDRDAGVRRDVERALRLVEGACKQAFAASCTPAVEIALMAGNNRLAETWAIDGCATAEFACESTGDLLDRGPGGTRNPAAAKHLYKLGCERGSERACLKLGSRTSAAPTARLRGT